MKGWIKCYYKWNSVGFFFDGGFERTKTKKHTKNKRTNEQTNKETNEQRPIRHYITCPSSNVVYMIQCNKCNVQYIGAQSRKRSHNDDQPAAVSDHLTLPTVAEILFTHIIQFRADNDNFSYSNYIIVDSILSTN